MVLHFPDKHVQVLIAALRSAGDREIGGVLMGEHVGMDEFRILDMTIQRRGGTVSGFSRALGDAVSALLAFFRRTKNEYTRFNYLGEWHSHPQYAPYPSQTDNDTMMRIVNDIEVGANFAVLVIAKLSNGSLCATASVYTRNGRSEARLCVCQTCI